MYKVFLTDDMHTPTTFNQSRETGPLARYDSAGPLADVLSHNEIVAKYDNGMTAILQQSISDKQPIHFMPTEVSDDIKGTPPIFCTLLVL